MAETTKNYICRIFAEALDKFAPNLIFEI